ncbi:hypothetical protein RDWZM_004008 [Blomia tropicalis]|uniref:phenylalanine--tRNA ligase n=1 Tax=Blomia tropicalis TaxID=40697 RepID=A0A9Q0MHY6_BLOTA|nr:hypothetical protein RDWZM_004008 [Blomia tropicalis]
MLRTISKQIYRSFGNVPNIFQTNLFPNSLLKSKNYCLTQQRYKFKRVGDRPLGQQLQILDSVYQSDEWTNVPDKVIELIGRDLYRTPGNPIYLISETLRQNYADHHCYEFTNPVVDVWSNFDSILVPEDHISRKRTDTFYVDAKHVLRAHTSAHQSCCFEKCFQDGKDGKFIVIGDVYRRDEVNRTHHAAFHQCEVVQLYQNNDSEMIKNNVNDLFDLNQPRTELCQERHNPAATKVVENEMKTKVEDYIKRLLGKNLETKWVDAYFPFTHPSWELEIKTPDGEWLEMLGCGIIEQKILDRCGQSNHIGWALGLGLERLAMLYYTIPDIRLFWTRDTGFLVQFSTLEPFERITYRPISSYPQKIFDISFWLPVSEERVNEWSPNDVHAIILDIGGEMVEQAHLVDEWKRAKDGRISNCYRIVYRSMERALTNSEVNLIHHKIEKALIDQLHVQIR